jgi:hypothetical protein
MSIRFKIILPYLLLTLIVAVTGAYVVTRLVTSSLSERLTNQLLESGRVVSDFMVRQEIAHINSARAIAFTRGLAEALRDGDTNQIILLAKPVAGGANVENVLVFDKSGNEKIHLIKQSDGTFFDVSQPDRASTLSIVEDLLNETN